MPLVSAPSTETAGTTQSAARTSGRAGQAMRAYPLAKIIHSRPMLATDR